MIKSLRYWKYSDFYIIAFVFYILGSYGVPMLGWNTIFLRVPLYIFILLCCSGIILKRRKFNSRFFLWYFIFFVYSMFSILYSPNFSVSAEMFSYIFTAMIYSLSFITFLQLSNSYLIIKYIYIIVSIFVGINLILNFSQLHWWSRLGESFGMNENMVALYFLIPWCFALTELSNSKKVVKCLNLSAVIVCSYVILLSGSKKALFAAFLFALVYYFVKSQNPLKKFKVLILISIIAIIVFQMIMKVPRLYNILGYRLEAMFFTFQTNSFGNVGSSTAERGDMIKYAISLFKSSPLVGHGINSFKVLYGLETGHSAYAHNNYAEILADLGFIGFIAFYSIYFQIIKRILINRKKKKELAEFIAFLVMLLFFDIAMVTYYDTRILMLISIVYYHVREARVNK